MVTVIMDGTCKNIDWPFVVGMSDISGNTDENNLILKTCENLGNVFLCEGYQFYGQYLYISHASSCSICEIILKEY